MAGGSLRQPNRRARGKQDRPEPVRAIPKVSTAKSPVASMNLPWRRSAFLAGSLVVLFGILSPLAITLTYQNFPIVAPRENGAGTERARLRLAVLGDSDSHAYQDQITFPPSSADRGGRNRAATFQWTEVLERSRGEYVDQGSWDAWGVPPRLAKVQRLFGAVARTPRKQDYAYNFAISGAGCEQLSGGWQRQALALAAAIRSAPSTWQGAVVVIRIGINSIGRLEHLERFAANDLTEVSHGLIDTCIAEIDAAIRLLRAEQIQLHFLLVGIADNSDWPPYLDRWHTASAIAGIRAANDRFDAGLRRLAERDPQIRFFDDRAWFRDYFGGRTASGEPAYRTLRVLDDLVVSNSQGDSFDNLILADGHAGTVLNALWVRDLIPALNALTGRSIPEIGEREFAQLLRGLRALGTTADSDGT
jgi:hypothetical protein